MNILQNYSTSTDVAYTMDYGGNNEPYSAQEKHFESSY